MRWAGLFLFLGGCVIVTGEGQPDPPPSYDGYVAAWPDVRDVVWLEAFASNWPEIREGEAARAKAIPDGDLFMLLYLARYSRQSLHETLARYKGDLQALASELRYPQLQLIVTLDEPVPSNFAGAYRMQGEHAPGPLTNPEFSDLVQLRLAVDYFGLSAREAFSKLGEGWTFEKLFLVNFDKAGAGRHTMEGHAVVFGPRPWDLNTRDAFLRARNEK